MRHVFLSENHLLQDEEEEIRLEVDVLRKVSTVNCTSLYTKYSIHFIPILLHITEHLSRKVTLGLKTSFGL